MLGTSPDCGCGLHIEDCKFLLDLLGGKVLTRCQGPNAKFCTLRGVKPKQPRAALLDTNDPINRAKPNVGWLVGIAGDGGSSMKGTIEPMTLKIDVFADFIGIDEFAQRCKLPLIALPRRRTRNAEPTCDLFKAQAEVGAEPKRIDLTLGCNGIPSPCTSCPG